MKYSTYPSPKESIGLLFWQTSTLWQRAIKEALGVYGLTHTQYVILAVIEELSEKGGRISQSDISVFSKIDPMTISSTLRLLEKKRLIRRFPDEKDTRANQIHNTPQSTALLIQAIQAVEKVDKDFFNFPVKGELQQFQILLKKLKSPFPQ